MDPLRCLQDAQDEELQVVDSDIPADPVEPVEPVDIPVDTHGSNDMYALSDEKAPDIVEAENQRSKELMDLLTKGFDPSDFCDKIMSSLSELEINLFPGTYNHLLILMFEAPSTLEGLQLKMEDWIREQYSCSKNIYSTSDDFLSEINFKSEIGMLRDLVQPIRGEESEAVYWVRDRCVQQPGYVCKQLEESINLIEAFKNDVCMALESGNEDRTIYSKPPAKHDIRGQEERAKIAGFKYARRKACQATLSWLHYMGFEIEFTAFFVLYRKDVIENQPAKARASGWLPPASSMTPRASAGKAEEGDPAYWPPDKSNNLVLDLILKTVLWLSIARGLPAVHLFCDIARYFTTHEPSQDIMDKRLCFLMHINRFRTHREGIQPEPSPNFPQQPTTFPDRNFDYFADTWKSKLHIGRVYLVGDSPITATSSVTAMPFRFSMPPGRTRRRASRANTHPPRNMSLADVGYMQSNTTEDNGTPGESNRHHPSNNEMQEILGPMD